MLAAFSLGDLLAFDKNIDASAKDESYLIVVCILQDEARTYVMIFSRSYGGELFYKRFRTAKRRLLPQGLNQKPFVIFSETPHDAAQ
jgi:hypothetical protein